jgi:hypothetical protein
LSHGVGRIAAYLKHLVESPGPSEYVVNTGFLLPLVTERETSSIPLPKARAGMELGTHSWEGYDDAIFPLNQRLLDGHRLVHVGPC